MSAHEKRHPDLTERTGVLGTIPSVRCPPLLATVEELRQRDEFLGSHPGWKIMPVVVAGILQGWRGILEEASGETIAFRYTLGELVDRLIELTDAMTAAGGAPLRTPSSTRPRHTSK